MKSKIHFYSYLLISLLTVSICSCNDDEPSEQEGVKNLLTKGGTWNLHSAKVDGMEKTDLYHGLTVSFSSGFFSSTNGGLIWPPAGTWAFEQGSAHSIVRDDEVVITIESISQKSMELSFTWSKTTFEGGRSVSISGEHILVFTRP